MENDSAKAAEHPLLAEVEEVMSKAQFQQRQLAALRDATSSFLRRDARLTQLRERTLLLRSRAKFQWKACHDYRRFVKQSQEAFNDEAAVVMSQPSSEDHEERIKNLHRLHEQVIQDFDAQNAYAERANDLQTELGALEHKLQVREASVTEAAGTMQRILSEIRLPAHSSAATAVETDVPPSPTTQPSEDLDPLIERYFQKLGALNGLLEQSVEIEVDYAEARAEREFKFEHEQSLEVPDETFEEQWREKRNNITQQIVEARAVADRLRDVCLDDGLDPEMYRGRARRDSDRSVSDSAPEEISQLLPSADDIPMLEEGGFIRTRESSEDGLGGFRVLTPGTFITRTSHEPRSSTISPVPSKARVLDWIQDVDEQDRIVQSLPGGEHHERPTRRSLPAEMAPDPRFLQLLRSSRPVIYMDKHSDESGGIASQGQPQVSALQRRPSSDSDLVALLSQGDAYHVEGLKGSGYMPWDGEEWRK